MYLVLGASNSRLSLGSKRFDPAGNLFLEDLLSKILYHVKIHSNSTETHPTIPNKSLPKTKTSLKKKVKLSILLLNNFLSSTDFVL